MCVPSRGSRGVPGRSRRGAVGGAASQGRSTRGTVDELELDPARSLRDEPDADDLDAREECVLDLRACKTAQDRESPDPARARAMVRRAPSSSCRDSPPRAGRSAGRRSLARAAEGGVLRDGRLHAEGMFLTPPQYAARQELPWRQVLSPTDRPHPTLRASRHCASSSTSSDAELTITRSDEGSSTAARGRDRLRGARHVRPTRRRSRRLRRDRGVGVVATGAADGRAARRMTFATSSFSGARRSSISTRVTSTLSLSIPWPRPRLRLLPQVGRATSQAVSAARVLRAAERPAGYVSRRVGRARCRATIRAHSG